MESWEFTGGVSQKGGGHALAEAVAAAAAGAEGLGFGFGSPVAVGIPPTNEP